MKYILTIIIAIILFLPLHVSAQTKEIITEGTYNMGDGETPGVAESRALLNAKRVALEQAGTYVESYSKVINLQLTEDEIQVLASGIMEVEILDKKRTVIGDGIHFWVKIKAKVNLDKTEEMAKRVKEKDVIEDYKRIQEAYDKSQKDIEELKKQLAQSTDEKEKKKVEEKITDEERLFQANEWFVKGYRHGIMNEWDAAIEAFSSVIILNPNNARALYFRGLAYSMKNQYEKAIEDYNKVIVINPYFADAYYNRGDAYAEKDQHDRAIWDFNKTLDIDPNYALAYFNRGLVYFTKKQNDKAIEDFNKAIVLDHNLAQTYAARGWAFYDNRQFDNASSDLQKACDMGSQSGCVNLQKVLQKK